MQGKYFNNKKIVNPAVKNRREADNLINSAYKAFMLLGLMALRDEFKFGSERMKRYVDKMHDLLDSYNKGYISIEDLNQTIYEEIGIKVM
jgi:hypothetical protein